MAVAKPLTDLRAELADLDRQILTLVAARQRLSLTVGSTKRAAGLPLRDYRQEKAVINRSRATAAELGFAPELAEQLVLSLIRSSLTVQEHDEVVTQASGEGQRALVIGGAGKMGRWFVRFLDSQGFQVDRDEILLLNRASQSRQQADHGLEMLFGQHLGRDHHRALIPGRSD